MPVFGVQTRSIWCKLVLAGGVTQSIVESFDEGNYKAVLWLYFALFMGHMNKARSRRRIDSVFELELPGPDY